MEDTVTVIRFSQIVERPEHPVRQRRAALAATDRSRHAAWPSYRFLTTWLLEADRERVWDAIYDSERWPEWWQGVLEAEKLEEGDEDGRRPVRPLRLEVEAALQARVRHPHDHEVERPHLLEGDAERRARRASAAGGCSSRTGSPPSSTSGTCSTTKAWMNLLAPLARPVFAVNHDW